MNIFDIRYRHIKLSMEDTRLHNILPLVLSKEMKPSKKNSLLFQVQSTKQYQKRNNPSGFNVRMRRPSAHNNVVSYVSEALQVNSARRNRVNEQKENAPPKQQNKADSYVGFSTSAIRPATQQQSTVKLRQFRVVKQNIHKNSQMFVKDITDDPLQVEDTAATPLYTKVEYAGLFKVSDLCYEVAARVTLESAIQFAPVIKQSILMLINIQLFLSEINFWNPVKTPGRIKPQTRSVLVDLVQRCSVGFIHENAEVLNEFLRRLDEWRINYVCGLLINTQSKRGNHKFYDLENSLISLGISTSTQIVTIDTVSEDVVPKSLNQQVLLPLCPQQFRMVILLFRTCRKAGQLTQLSSCISVRNRTLWLKREEHTKIKMDEAIDQQQIAIRASQIQFLKSVSSIRKQHFLQNQGRVPMCSLQESKDKLNKYMKIVQGQSLTQNRQFSATYLIGDIIKRNYIVHNQLQNYKYFTLNRHQKILTQIKRVNQQPSQAIEYSAAIYLLNCRVNE